MELADQPVETVLVLRRDLEELLSEAYSCRGREILREDLASEIEATCPECDHEHLVTVFDWGDMPPLELPSGPREGFEKRLERALRGDLSRWGRHSGTIPTQPTN